MVLVITPELTKTMSKVFITVRVGTVNSPSKKVINKVKIMLQQITPYISVAQHKGSFFFCLVLVCLIS